jgi:hypothetical protein
MTMADIRLSENRGLQNRRLRFNMTGWFEVLPILTLHIILGRVWETQLFLGAKFWYFWCTLNEDPLLSPAWILVCIHYRCDWTIDPQIEWRHCAEHSTQILEDPRDSVLVLYVLLACKAS